MTKRHIKSEKSIHFYKSLLVLAKLTEKLSLNLATPLVAKLFSTPIKYETPKREFKMELDSSKQKIFIPAIKKQVQVYNYGNGSKKALLVHGWSGRGTQLSKIAEALLNSGYQTFSFDAPAHGKSEGTTTIMLEFIACIHELEKKVGPFEIAIGHSLGGMSILNAVKQKLNIKKAVIISSGDDIQDIVVAFIKKTRLNPKIAILLKNYFETKYGDDMEKYSSYIAAKEVYIPILLIHDENDSEVPVSCAYHISKHLNNCKLIITQNLGHNKLLGDNDVINQIVNFTEK